MGGAAESESGPVAVGSGRSGPIRTSVDRLIRDLAEASRVDVALRSLPAERAVLAVLARQYAWIADRAASAGDESRLMVAGEKLRVVLGQLQPKAADPEGGASGDGGAGGSVRELFSGVPSVGNRAHS